MRLATIKIAGFKSFVDPTVIALPSQRVAIVGPNGCGKSNVIDAVTWVMGESSPKYLRGEALTDVIFNGSSTRKPIGQASVELIFDNADGSIGGEYAKYAEIAIKRMINRESDSTYYLNGVRCRKRDIVDIFLGTGLGPRSYSIIGQNMISRVIEAKPDELRTYLEEAAGISKYKERRHETELRIQHTNENLARVYDLRGELENQLSHLKHQANVAEKFKSYKQQERVLRAELYGIQWRNLDSKMVEYTLKINREETALEARNSQISGTDREIELTRHEQRVAQDAFQEIQRRYYAIGNEITRIEQDILYHQERSQQWENDLKEVEENERLLKEQIEEAEDTLREDEHDIAHITPQLDSAKKELTYLLGELQKAEEHLQYGQNKWDDFQHASAKTAQEIQVEKTRVQHLEQQIQFLKNRTAQLQQEEARYDFKVIQKDIENLARQAFESNAKLTAHQSGLTSKRSEFENLREVQEETNLKLDKIRHTLQKLNGQKASLEALQQTALGQRNNRTADWVLKHELTDKPRLGQHIEVEKGWELVLEKALGSNLQAICVDSLSALSAQCEDFKSGNLCIFSAVAPKSIKKKLPATRLLDKVKSPWPLNAFLADIYVAETLEEAQKLCEQLSDHESVMTKDGLWVNRAWLKILREEDPAVGVFQREQELKELNKKIEQRKRDEIDLEKTIAKCREHMQKLEVARDELQTLFNQQQTELTQITAQQNVKTAHLIELKKQHAKFLNDKTDCYAQLEKAKTDCEKAVQRLAQANTDLHGQTHVREGLMAERDKARVAVQTLRDSVTQYNEKKHELEMRLQAAQSQKIAIKQTLNNLHAQHTQLNNRKITLQSELASMSPLDSIKKSLTRALDKHISVEVELNTARVAVEALDQEFRKLEEKRQLLEREINKVRTALEGLRLECQGYKVKSDTILEQIKETEFTLEAILKELPQEITAEEWQAKLDQIVQRINRLGPINLVAIEEYATCLERKEYLDKQTEDLETGLKTLHDAIAKIDKETKMRFKDTFDMVNARFQELFPIVFGGGKAYLELTSEDLLTAGVSMMACPPGKRNSSIYLLSGGEKSLTAIALIFSIFHLNPAPFCLLDEVDAALDDANVLRFAKLVKTMTDKTQFVFISHNKITIEMADHLIGVTMNEPGVSRLVSVDIQKAMALAGA